MKKIILGWFCSVFFLVAGAQHEQHATTNDDPKRSQQRGLRRVGKVVEYHLYVNDTTVNFTGKRRKALAVNGEIPAPTLYFTEGDSAIIHVHNLMKHEVSFHWHGVLLPNEQDGVPLLNTTPIHGGMTHTFRYRIIQNGTLWYHSHTHVQEQIGLYGALVFYPPTAEPQTGKKEEVLLLSDWRDERPEGIFRSLKRRNEWYAIKKKAVQSWGEAIAKGHFSDKVQMEWTRMPGADVSDVYYQKHLMHGQPERTFEKYRKGDSIRLRVINGSAATYYWLHYSGGKMKVIAADGSNVKPVEVDKILIATAETYDIMIKIPDDGQYEFRATAQDITLSASAFFGSGPQVKAKDIPPLDYMVLMNEMNRMTWMMKGMGMDMKMGLYMKMDMSKMAGTDHGAMNMDDMNMDHGNMPMDSMDHSKMNMDTTDHSKMNMDSMNHPGMADTTIDHSKMNMDSANQHMNHGNTPSTQKAPTNKKPTTTSTKKPVTKSPAKKAPVKKAPPKKPAPKKPAPKKPAPKKPDPHAGHNMKMMSYSPSANSNFFNAVVTHESNIESLKKNTQSDSYSFATSADTIPKKSSSTTPMTGHNMHNMKIPAKDTAPKSKSPTPMTGMSGIQHSSMNMAGMQGGMQKNTKDTTRSYMLQTMMPKTPMTGFDFPPGNGDDIVLSYDMLVSDSGATTLPANRPWREVELTLTGNMQRFVWSINGETLSEQDKKILIRKGENVRVVFINATMMEHPIHLHGHFFRLINSRGASAPMKHTFNVNAMHTQVMEFAATEEKDWFLHCHILYHMAAGMATIFSYEGTTSEVQKEHPKAFEKFKRKHGSQVLPWANASLHSQGTFGTVVLSGRKFQIDQDWKWNWKKSFELETKFQYFLDKRQFFSAFIGGEYEKNNMRNGKEVPAVEKEQIGTVGLIYTLPFFINVEGRVDHRGKLRFQAIREDLPLTTRTRLDFYWNTDKEYGIETRYIVAKYLALSANYDSDFGWGAGISIIY